MEYGKTYIQKLPNGKLAFVRRRRPKLKSVGSLLQEAFFPRPIPQPAPAYEYVHLPMPQGPFSLDAINRMSSASHQTTYPAPNIKQTPTIVTPLGFPSQAYHVQPVKPTVETRTTCSCCGKTRSPSSRRKRKITSVCVSHSPACRGYTASSTSSEQSTDSGIDPNPDKLKHHLCRCRSTNGGKSCIKPGRGISTSDSFECCCLRRPKSRLCPNGSKDCNFYRLSPSLQPTTTSSCPCPPSCTCKSGLRFWPEPPSYQGRRTCSPEQQRDPRKLKTKPGIIYVSPYKPRDKEEDFCPKLGRVRPLKPSDDGEIFYGRPRRPISPSPEPRLRHVETPFENPARSHWYASGASAVRRSETTNQNRNSSGVGNNVVWDDDFRRVSDDQAYTNRASQRRRSISTPPSYDRSRRGVEFEPSWNRKSSHGAPGFEQHSPAEKTSWDKKSPDGSPDVIYVKPRRQSAWSWAGPQSTAHTQPEPVYAEHIPSMRGRVVTMPPSVSNRDAVQEYSSLRNSRWNSRAYSRDPNYTFRGDQAYADPHGGTSGGVNRNPNPVSRSRHPTQYSGNN
ncbi:hypothetical protein FQN57_005798 [Myotisia sp. PD_48]|nr:hypothetical protein FQN57_005798 [Myotisia sp. PD_48]